MVIDILMPKLPLIRVRDFFLHLHTKKEKTEYFDWLSIRFRV